MAKEQAKFFFLIVAAVTFALFMITSFQLVFFLTFNDNRGMKHVSHVPKDSKSGLTALCQDVMLLVIFAVQHSVMTLPIWKGFIDKLGLGPAQRCIYVICSCMALQFMMTHWQSIGDNSPLWSPQSTWLFLILHSIGWVFIAGSFLIVDYSELLGLKQIYYHAIGLDPAISQKSPSLQRLYSHFRHPVFTGPMIVLWMQPVMTLDRLLLAVIWTTYLVLCHRLNYSDHQYLKEQLQLKHHHLTYH
ncbi:nurim-like [Glandiceps talaboti]